LSNRLREKYPQEMTIVLQHQFWDLGVTEHAFEVGLSFSGVPERLLIPFDALTGFFDPSVQFGLKFEVQEEEQVEAPPAPSPEPARPARGAGSEPVELQPKKTPAPVGGRSPTPRLPPKSPSQTGKSTDGDDGQPAEERKGEAGAEVVSLDAFRKKN
jgi:hypothetical protein